MIWPRPQKILMTADTIGGVWTYAVELARALREYDIEVALATMGRAPTERQISEVATLGNTQLFPSAFALEWMEDPWEDVKLSGEWLLRIAKRIQPDLIHLNTMAHGALPWDAPCLVVGHSCVYSWWQAVLDAKPPTEWRRYHFEVARGLRAAKAVVAPSFAMLESLQRFYGPLANCEVIPNGIELLDIESAKEPLILSAGRLWDRAKNVGMLAEIAADLPWQIVVAGDCGEEPPRQLRCLGELSRGDLADWQRRAAIYAAPAKYEPFGLGILEAASAGCALVLGDIPSLRENWDGAAEFAHPDDKESWKRILRELATDEARRSDLATRARKRAEEFSVERMTNAYLSLYSETMENRVHAITA
jgi:glycogen(starch) synthase